MINPSLSRAALVIALMVTGVTPKASHPLPLAFAFSVIINATRGVRMKSSYSQPT
jgi:hypothetical protein